MDPLYDCFKLLILYACLQESGQTDREGMTVAEIVQHGLPGNSQRNDTYADQLRHMAAPGVGGQKLTDSAVDRWVE